VQSINKLAEIENLSEAVSYLDATHPSPQNKQAYG
jgi:hypothetical protein